MDVYLTSLSGVVGGEYMVLIPTSDDNRGPILSLRMHVYVAHEFVTAGDVVIGVVIRGRLCDRLRECWYTIVVLLAYGIVLSRSSSTCSL